MWNRVKNCTADDFYDKAGLRCGKIKRLDMNITRGTKSICGRHEHCFLGSYLIDAKLCDTASIVKGILTE